MALYVDKEHRSGAALPNERLLIILKEKRTMILYSSQDKGHILYGDVSELRNYNGAITSNLKNRFKY